MPRYLRARQEQGLTFDLIQKIIDMQKDIEFLKAQLCQINGTISSLQGVTGTPAGGPGSGP